MREIGGYLEFEKFHGNMQYEEAIALNCGRNCLAYLIEAKNIKKLAVPYLMCDCIFEVCKRMNVEMIKYQLQKDFTPKAIPKADDLWVYIMNYYGMLSKKQLGELKDKYSNIIIDNAQAYFTAPLENTDTLYTCRKFFGVADGAFLFSDARLTRDLETETSWNRMEYLLGRYEGNASTFYNQSVDNNTFFDSAPIKKMSKLTNNLLHGIDYEIIKQKRTKNFTYLHEHIASINELTLPIVTGAFAYPLLITNDSDLREKLIEKNIYIPLLWPNVLKEMSEKSFEYQMARYILPLPCDQRYSLQDMQYLVEEILNITKTNEEIE